MGFELENKGFGDFAVGKCRVLNKRKEWLPSLDTFRTFAVYPMGTDRNWG